MVTIRMKSNTPQRTSSTSRSAASRAPSGRTRSVVVRALTATSAANAAPTLFGREFQILENYGRPLLGDTESEGPGYFVLGDNRDDSVDSRDFGRLEEGQVKCRAIAKLGSSVSGLKDARWL